METMNDPRARTRSAWPRVSARPRDAPDDPKHKSLLLTAGTHGTKSKAADLSSAAAPSSKSHSSANDAFQVLPTDKAECARTRAPPLQAAAVLPTASADDWLDAHAISEGRLPRGWTYQIRHRGGGESRGRTDRVWAAPDQSRIFRSLTQALAFVNRADCAPTPSLEPVASIAPKGEFPVCRVAPTFAPRELTCVYRFSGATGACGDRGDAVVAAEFVARTVAVAAARSAADAAACSVADTSAIVPPATESAKRDQERPHPSATAAKRRKLVDTLCKGAF